MKFIIDLIMDGYNSPEEELDACKVFINEQLDFSGSSVQILSYGYDLKEALIELDTKNEEVVCMSKDEFNELTEKYRKLNE